MGKGRLLLGKMEMETNFKIQFVFSIFFAHQAHDDNLVLKMCIDSTTDGVAGRQTGYCLPSNHSNN